MSSSEIDPKLNEAEAAAHCGLRPPTMATLRCRGGGPPYFKIGRRVCYSKRDLDQWLAARRVTSTADTSDAEATATVAELALETAQRGRGRRKAEQDQ